MQKITESLSKLNEQIPVEIDSIESEDIKLTQAVKVSAPGKLHKLSLTQCLIYK